MNKAQAVRKRYLEGTAAVSCSLPSGRAQDYANTTVAWLNNQAPDLNGLSLDDEAKLPFDTYSPAQQLQPAGTGTEPMSFSWDQWLATGPPVQMGYTNELDQMAWTNWESFVDDFQARGDYVPGPDSALPPLFNTW